MKQLFRTIRTHILVGAVLITPLAVTIWVVLFLIDLLSNSAISRWLASPILSQIPGGESRAAQAGISLMVAIGLLFCVGLIFRNFLGRRVYNLLDRALENTPLINTVYTFVRTVSESIVSQKETMFQEVVLVPFPSKGSYAVAFVSSEVPASMQRTLDEDHEEHIFVFLPTTPNPTSGYLLLFPRKDCIPMDMSPNEAMRTIVSAGASTHGGAQGAQVPSLLDKLEQMAERHRHAGLPPRPEPVSNLNLANFKDPEELDE